MSDHLMVDCAYAEHLLPYHRHVHMTYELIYIKQGQARITIADRQYLVSDHTRVLINCFEEHAVEILSERYERYYVNLSKPLLDALLSHNETALINMLRNRPTGFCHCFAVDNRLAPLFEGLLAEFPHQDAPFSHALCAAHLIEILVHTYRSYPDSFCQTAEDAPSTIYAIQSYIDQHFAEDIQISTLADQFFINKYYLSHTFKKVTGYSPKQYLTLTRISYVKSLLSGTDQSVGQIALQAGFADSNSLIRLFKQQAGMTPTQFRHHAMSETPSQHHLIMDT